MPAWNTPDPADAPATRIDARVELQLLERSANWAHIVCNNGWSAWVDGRNIEALPASGPAAPVSRPAPGRPAPATAPVLPSPAVGEASSWQPTHVAPDGGIAAWAAPQPAGQPVTRIDAGVELRLLERSGDWAHIVCTNGWSAWVAGWEITEVRRQ